MIEDITNAAENVGIRAVVTNSDARIESQLNRLTDTSDTPTMLITWDLDSRVDFDEHGLLKNPSTNVVLLLLTKADDTSKIEYEAAADAMGQLFLKFLQELYIILMPKMRSQAPPITGAGWKRLPKHGAAKHSGCLGRFTMLSEITNECIPCEDQ